MALSSEVKKLVDAEKWQEAYNLADGDVSSSDDSFLVQIEDSASGKSGYLKGDATNYSLVINAEDASSLSKKDANQLVKQIRSDEISTTLVTRSAVVQNVGSQGTERGEVINLFLDQRYAKKDNINIDPARDIITKWIEELGFTYNDNYFLQFMDQWIKKHKSVDGRIFEIVNDLYANDIITSLDLQAKTSAGTDSILFNKNLYKYSYENVEFIMQAYVWLENPLNIKSYMTNKDALVKYNIVDINKIDKQKAIEIRDSVIFTNPADTKNGEINSAETIQRETRFFQAGGDSQIDNSGATEKTLTVGAQVKDAEKWKNLTSTNIKTAQDAQDLINHLAKEFKLV